MIAANGRRRLFGVATLLAFGKPPYAAVTLLPVATPARVFGGMKPYVGFRSLALSIGIACPAAPRDEFRMWTAPGSPFVGGIQRRHLLPFMPLLFIAIGSPVWISQPLSCLRPIFVVAFLVVSGAATLVTVINRYY